MLEKDIRSVIELHQRALDATIIKRSHIMSSAEIGLDELRMQAILNDTEEFLKEQIKRINMEENNT